jgi:hypothetical protein
MNKDDPAESAEADCEPLPRTGAIDQDSPAELKRWAKAFGVPETILQHAIRIVGNSVSELRKLFCRD